MTFRLAGAGFMARIGYGLQPIGRIRNTVPGPRLCRSTAAAFPRATDTLATPERGGRRSRSVYLALHPLGRLTPQPSCTLRLVPAGHSRGPGQPFSSEER